MNGQLQGFIKFSVLTFLFCFHYETYNQFIEVLLISIYFHACFIVKHFPVQILCYMLGHAMDLHSYVHNIGVAVGPAGRLLPDQ